MWHDNETERDLIGFERFAATVSLLVTDKNVLPVTIGLFGDWGSGKSSILRMIETDLQAHQSVLVLRFDGWLFEGYDDAKAALMTTIVDLISQHIRQNETLWQRTKPKIISLMKRIDWFRVMGLAGKGILTLTSPAGAAVVAGLTLTETAKTIAEKAADAEALEGTIHAAQGLIKDEAPAIDEVHKSVREFRSEFESLIDEAKIGSLVVLIDDLDRCLPESIVATLEAIKLFLSVKGTAFVIAADERIVRYAITQRYPSGAYQEYDLAQEYLDKLVQIPLKLPPMDEVETETYIYLLFAQRLLGDDDLHKLCVTVKDNRGNIQLRQPLNFGIAVTCLGEHEAAKLEDDFALAARVAPILAQRLGGNPRLAKRFLNAFALRWRLSQAQHMNLDQATLIKLMVLERFHEDRFKELFGWQAQQLGIPDELDKLESAARAGTADDLDGNLKLWLTDPSLMAWLGMEPHLAGVNLFPYFHLARESLRVISGGQRLSQEQQEILTGLQSRSDAAQRTAAKRLSIRPEEEVVPIYDALWSKLRTNPANAHILDGLFQLSYLHEASAHRLIADVKMLSPGNVNPASVPKFAMIRQHHPGLTTEVQDQLERWAKSTDARLQAAAAAVLEANKQKR